MYNNDNYMLINAYLTFGFSIFFSDNLTAIRCMSKKNNQIARGKLIINVIQAIVFLKITYGLQGYGTSISDLDAVIPQKLLYPFQSL